MESLPNGGVEAVFLAKSFGEIESDGGVVCLGDGQGKFGHTDALKMVHGCVEEMLGEAEPAICGPHAYLSDVSALGADAGAEHDADGLAGLAVEDEK